MIAANRNETSETLSKRAGADQRKRDTQCH
jgi:hypothetical protein